MSYRWQVQKGGQWTDLPDNESTEKDYSDPKNAYSSGSPPVHFDTMTCGHNKVQRLPYFWKEPNFSHTSDWHWYWQDDLGKWNLYGLDSDGDVSGAISSAYLEQKYLNDDEDVEFSIGSQSYSLSFQDMIQTNKYYGTKRLVSRRPRFIPGTDVLGVANLGRMPQTISLPDNWDKTRIPQKGYKKISLLCTSNEFKTIEALFHKTMRSFDIICIERIQNKALWEVYQWQKNQMKITNGGLDVTEKQLFHGTASENVDAICTNNFDWRICGTHGILYGKGSYFARDASYSDSYTGAHSVKTVFVSRVLVGCYTKGDPGYVRPPSKDGGNINFYDSCVDNITKPSIFVVFEKNQIYPEYLLQYIGENDETVWSTTVSNSLSHVKHSKSFLKSNKKSKDCANM